MSRSRKIKMPRNAAPVKFQVFNPSPGLTTTTYLDALASYCRAVETGAGPLIREAWEILSNVHRAGGA